MQRTKTVPARAVTEQIYSYEVYPRSNIVRVTILSGELPPGETLLDPQVANMSVIEVTEDLCTELLSNNPSWATGKPADYFKEDDLWDAVDAHKVGGTVSAISTARQQVA